MSNATAEEVARKLGGPDILGMEVRSEAELAQAVRNRLPLRVIVRLREAGFDEDEIESYVIPNRTRRHRGDSLLAVAQTGAGARVIETILAKIAWGAAA